VHDLDRVTFVKAHVENVILSVTEDKINVIGYFLWALYDNFEWAVGYSQRFGMIHVDYENGQARYFKDSALFYKEWIKNNS
jgi:beta-glucosidase